jgi:hypothetical protein
MLARISRAATFCPAIRLSGRAHSAALLFAPLRKDQRFAKCGSATAAKTLA